MKNKKNTLGIYVHIPFCLKKCNYCDFCSSEASSDVKDKYTNCLIKEISSETSRKYLREHSVDTVYFGGGTPTCLSPKALGSILDAIFNSYSVSNNTEITFECNPGTVDHLDLKELRSIGFNRVSIGLQSTHDEELQILGRIHDFNDFDLTFKNARTAGFDNISLDLMYGLPGQTLSSFEDSLNTVNKYSPEHISAYSLKIEPGTVFYENKDQLILPDEDSEYNMYKAAVDILGSAGYAHYEISNYAREGYESRHNKKYWHCDDYAGFGISAHSCLGTKRYSNTCSIGEYFSFHNGTGRSYTSLEEDLTREEFAEEYIMMRMRLSEGISQTEYKERFGDGFDEKYMNRILPYIKSGHIIYEKTSGTIRFTTEGMYVSNYILSNILDLGQ